MRYFVYALLALLHTVAYPQVDTLDFPTAVRIARQQNIDLKLLQNQMELLRARRAQAYLQFSPQVSLNANAFQINGLQFDQVAGQLFNTTSDQVSAVVSAQVDIFNGMSRVRRLQATREQVMAQQQGVEQQEQQLVALVAEQYLQTLLDRELAVIARRNLEEQREQLAMLEAYAEAGIRPITDYYNQQAEVKRLELALIRAENQHRLDQAQLRQTLQLDPTRAFVLSNPREVEWALAPDTSASSLGSLYQTALTRRADVRQQQIVIDAQERLVAAERGNYLPSLSAFLDYGTSYSSLSGVVNAEGVVEPNPFNNQFFDRNPQAVYGLSLRVPIFNRHQTRAAVVRARVGHREQKLLLEQLKQRVLTDVQQAHLNWEAAREQLAAARVSVEAAELALEAQEERFKLGVALLLEYNAARTALVSARAELAQAQFASALRKVMLDFQTGQLQDDFVE
ncbi:MAG: TolC family protein [Catalinimonas sp.]